MDKNSGPCSLKNVTEDNLFLDSFKKPCHFHMTERSFDENKMMPKHICSEMYYLTYPYYFATAYGANFGKELNNKFTIKCPDKNKRVNFILHKTPSPTYEKLKNIVKKALGSSMIYQVAMQYCGVKLKVEKEKGLKSECPKTEMFNKNDFNINFGDEEGKSLCPAGFRSMFPYHAIMHLRRKIGIKNRSFPLVTCPDHLKQLMFSVQKKNHEKEDSHESLCSIIDNVTIRADDEKLKIEDLMKKIGFPCPVMFSIIFPYYLTVNNGGKLGFYTGKHRSAMVQCPNSQVKIHTEVGLSKNKDCFEINITNQGGCKSCPKNIKSGNKYKIKLSDDKLSKYNYHDLNYILLYSIISKEAKSESTIQGPFNDNIYKVS